MPQRPVAVNTLRVEKPMPSQHSAQHSVADVQEGNGWTWTKWQVRGGAGNSRSLGKPQEAEVEVMANMPLTCTFVRHPN
jgi:hypothetical protein